MDGRRALQARVEGNPQMPRSPWLICWLGAAIVGCASYQGSARDVASGSVAAESGWIRVEHVPPVRQAGAKDCGAAALSSVLRYWQRAPSPAAERSAIDAALRQDPKQGLSAGALRDYARGQGFRAFVFQGTFADLNHEVAEGRPVIVGVHKALSDGKALTHYEVFLGIQPQKQLVLTFDPARGLEENSLAGFMQEWNGSGQVTLVILPSATRS